MVRPPEVAAPGKPENPIRPTWVEPLIGRAKPHTRGDPGPMFLCYNTFSNTPTVETLGTTNVETGQKIQKHRSGQTLREDVRKLGGHQYVHDADIIDGNAFPDEVEVDGADVVTIDESAL
jgi:hypothetical protein